ncbi:YheC/YheD family protein [Virgibacillus sp. CBA3643]|uniref:YheC/YheD family protein n=1 Tax=Virgibacillus sp. CBA3643 TaxID=2942278 RepID=UPI0035A3469C
MLVGFMQRSTKPSKIAKVTALMCSHYGIDLIYLTPWDVNQHDGMIKGKMYRQNKWISVKKELPPIIDVSSKCFKKDTKEIMDYLRNNTTLTFDKKNTPNKEKLQDELSKDSNFAHLVIPTSPLDSFQRLEDFLAKYNSIIMKPLFGNRGRGLHSLRKQGNQYILGYREEEKKLSHDQLLDYYNNFLTDEKYILQKLIESKTNEGYPFDCRVQVQKNGNGKWVVAKNFFRIGIGQKVMSNVHQGGGISDVEPFLKANFKNHWKEINQKLEDLAETLPYKIEKIKGTPTMDLGFDIGIDRDGKLYLFESNNGATKKPLIAESAMLRVEYYQYIRETYLEPEQEMEKDTKMKSATLDPQIKELQDKNQALIQERDVYRKKWSQMQQSRSWRLTGPIRKISSLLKK